MVMWKDFLVEHAKFPFPKPDENRTVCSTRASALEASLLDVQWKASYAIRDDDLFHKLCTTLDNILRDAVLPEGAQEDLLRCFSPALYGAEWSTNPIEAKSKSLLLQGFFPAARTFLRQYGPYEAEFVSENDAEGASSRVDFVMKVDEQERLLVEVKSPSVMAQTQLPMNGMKLMWNNEQGLVGKIFTKVALNLAQRKLEWLFLTSHNRWIVFRLVSHDTDPFLAYSSKISIYNSSEPFRAFLGAILSVVKEVPVAASIFNPNLEFDVIEEEDQDPSSEENDIEDPSKSYRGSSSEEDSGGARITRARARAHKEPELMITSSSQELPDCSRTWVHLYTLSNNALDLPQCAQNNEHRVWLTRTVGSGSTGAVWQCHFNGDTEPFALKVVEVLRRSDADRRKRLRHEFGVYRTLENAYASGQLRDRIAPRCYGAFEGDHIDVLILDFCNGALNTWNELSTSERAEVYRLVQDLHSVGIIHGDLEPRNVMRAQGGGFLVDFSETGSMRAKKARLTNCMAVKSKSRSVPSYNHCETCCGSPFNRSL